MHTATFHKVGFTTEYPAAWSWMWLPYFHLSFSLFFFTWVRVRRDVYERGSTMFLVESHQRKGHYKWVPSSSLGIDKFVFRREEK